MGCHIAGSTDKIQLATSDDLRSLDHQRAHRSKIGHARIEAELGPEY